MDVWVLCFGPKLVESRENWSAVIHFINGGHGSLTPEEKDSATQDHKSMTKKIAELVKDRKEIEKRVKQAVQHTAKAKKNMCEKESAISNIKKWLRMEVEHHLNGKCQ